MSEPASSEAGASRYRNLQVGDPAPRFRQASTSNPAHGLDTIAGRYIVLCFFGSASDSHAREALGVFTGRRGLFDDEKITFFGVSIDPQDRDGNRVREDLPGLRHFWDFDGSVSRLYGAAPDGDMNGPVRLRRLWFVLDPMLRIAAVIPFATDGSDRARLVAFLDALPPVGSAGGFEVGPPILHLPNLFEPELCASLIELYRSHGGESSGFMRDIDGKTVLTHDPSHKRRSDHVIRDERLIALTRARVHRRIAPEIQRAHQFEATRMERYLVACYSDEDRGHFRPHRDNTTMGTAHRRFAVSINLNDDFDGGELAFPEYGGRTYKPAPGSAIVFSCSLLHAVTPVTRGRRFAFLPFLYDEAAARLREANSGHLAPGLGGYSTGAGDA